jgi:excisionase family DNA binding protein
MSAIITTPSALTLSIKEVAALFHVTTPTVRAWVRQGRLPPPLALSRRKLVWRAADVERLLDQPGVGPEESPAE